MKPHVQVADAKALPFPDKSFDVVVSINTIHNFPRAECGLALREIGRVARKGAFVTVDAYRDDEEREAHDGVESHRADHHACRRMEGVFRRDRLSGRLLLVHSMSLTSSCRLIHSMKRIRCVEETIAARYAEQKMRCPTHLSTGQEAVAAAAGAVLRRDDLAVSGHRAHAHYLAKGGSLPAMIAEIYGKATGCAGGNGGSMHLVDEAAGFMGSDRDRCRHRAGGRRPRLCDEARGAPIR